MKRLGAVVSCAVIAAFLLTGCQGPAKTTNDPNMVVLLTDSKAFPKKLAGKWIEAENKWEITFEKNGTVSSILHPFGLVNIVPGKTTIVPLIDDGNANIQAGKCVVQYSHQTRELVIEINIDNMLWNKGKEILEGNSKDIIWGKVSDDGTTWEAQWQSFPKYFVTTEGYNKYELPMDEGGDDKGIIVFKKSNK